MEKPTLKRAFAYIIDLMIVVFIIGLFTNIEALNPNYEKYEQAFESYKTLIAESENTNNSQTAKQATNVMYDLNKYSVSTSIINVVVMVLYFGLFQYYNKGQTIGKKLMKIKVVSNDGKKLKLSQVIIRMLIINSVLTSVILICLISFASKGLYISTSKYINMIDATLVSASIIMIMFKNDGRGLHDLLANTNVVYVNNSSEAIKEAKIIEKSNNRKKENL